MPRPPAEAHSPNPDYIGPELRAALLTLTAEERALVFGRVMEELDYDVLSERHGLPAPTLRKRYERARKKLAAALSSNVGAADPGGPFPKGGNTYGTKS